MSRFVFIALVLMLASGLIGSWWFSPEQRLKREVSSLFKTIEVPQTMSRIGRQRRGPLLAKHLAEQIAVNPSNELSDDVQTSYHRDQVSLLFSQAALGCSRLSVDHFEIVALDVQKDTARVTVTLDLVIEFQSRRPADGIQNFEMSWRLNDHHWRLESIAWAESPR